MTVNGFLNPKSMLTPGLAGGMVMGIANSLWVEFYLPKSITSLVLSYLIVILLLKNITVTKIEKIIYILLNGLIVFSMAVSTNVAGRVITEATYYRSDSPSFSIKGLDVMLAAPSPTVKHAADYKPSTIPPSITNEKPQPITFQNSTSQTRKFFDPFF